MGNSRRNINYNFQKSQIKKPTKLTQSRYNCHAISIIWLFEEKDLIATKIYKRLRNINKQTDWKKFHVSFECEGINKH